MIHFLQDTLTLSSIIYIYDDKTSLFYLLYVPKAFQLYCPGKTGKIPGRDLETLKVLGTKSLGNLGVQMSQDFPAPSFQFLHGFCFLFFELLCKKL